MKTKQVRILVVPPGAPSKVHTVGDSWKYWYPLISPSTHILQTLGIAPGLELLCDEEGALKRMEVNVLIPARAPQVDTSKFEVILVQAKTDDGRRLMMPNEPGIGYHEIRGTFILARRRGSGYTDLTDADIAQFQRMLGDRS